MLTPETQARIRASLTNVQQAVDQYRPRRGQRALIAAVAHTFAAEKDGPAEQASALLCNGGTGTGKGLGYTLPGLFLANERKKRFVIATSTTALQEQIYGKELPALREHSGIAFSFELAKGRGRYICLARLASERMRAQERDDDEKQAPALSASEAALLSDLSDQYRTGAWNGDRDQFGESVNDALWQRIASHHHHCAGTRCPVRADCAFYRARQKVLNADVIVTNHDLLLASLRTEPGSVLPPLDECLIALDEAHTLPEKAINQFSARHGIRSIAPTLRALKRLALQLVRTTGVQCAFVDAAAALGEALGPVQVLLEQHTQAQAIVRFPFGQVPPDLTALGGVVLERATALEQALQNAKSAILSNEALSGSICQIAVDALGDHLGNVGRLVRAWELLLRQHAPGSAPIAKWIERTKSDILVCAAPTEVSQTLREELWTKAAGVVLVSATLKAGGSFEPIRKTCGLDERTRHADIESPFDYKAQASLVVPSMRTDPSTPVEHTREALTLLPHYVHERGTLCLCASRELMLAIRDGLPEGLRSDVLMQGVLPKKALLAEHKRRVAQGRRSLLLGLAGLGEGVDLPGDEAACVIIPRIPFPSPDDPITRAQCEWVTSQGESAFDSVVLPPVARTLAQWVGRLIRKETDRGQVVIMDRRILTKRYGATLLRDLPPIRRVFGHRPERHTA